MIWPFNKEKSHGKSRRSCKTQDSDTQEIPSGSNERASAFYAARDPREEAIFPYDPFHTIPDPRESVTDFGEVIGYRVWDCYEGRLHSVVACAKDPRRMGFTSGILWKPREAMCSTVGSYNYGVHAFKTLKGASESGWFSHYNCVLGEVALWGKIIEHEEGYRAEFAYPTSLISVCINEFTPIANWKAKRKLIRDYGLNDWSWLDEMRDVYE